MATDYKIKKYGSIEDIFILCETCYWCVTYFDKSRLPTEKCPICLNVEMSSFPILPNESFTFNYNDKRGVDLEFRTRKKEKKKEQERKTNTTTIALKGKKDNNNNNYFLF